MNLLQIYCRVGYWKNCENRTPFLTRNLSDSVPATLTLASCFLYSLASKSIKCRGNPMSIIVTQSLSWEIESNAFLKSTKHIIEWLLVLPCLVHQYSEIRDLMSCPAALSESHLFICNFRFGLHSDPFQYDWSEEGSCLRGRQIARSIPTEWPDNIKDIAESSLESHGADRHVDGLIHC